MVEQSRRHAGIMEFMDYNPVVIHVLRLKCMPVEQAGKEEKRHHAQDGSARRPPGSGVHTHTLDILMQEQKFIRKTTNGMLSGKSISQLAGSRPPNSS
jgi:hypothetical protein